MTIERNEVDPNSFNPEADLPYELRLEDFEMAMQDVYDFFYDVNAHLAGRGLQRLDDMLRPAIMSGVLSDMITASLAEREPAVDRAAMSFREVYLGHVVTTDFRKNPPQRAWHQDGHAAQGWSEEAALELDIQALRASVRFEGAEGGNGANPYIEIVGILLDADAFVPDRFGRCEG